MGIQMVRKLAFYEVEEKVAMKVVSTVFQQADAEALWKAERQVAEWEATWVDWMGRWLEFQMGYSKVVLKAALQEQGLADKLD